jgi:hypothetical protein
MRLVSLGVIGALACAAVAIACTDQPSAPSMRPAFGEGSTVRIHGAGTFTVHGANGPETHALPAWSASGGVKNGVAREDGAAPALGVLGITNGAFTPAATDGRERTATFTDAVGHQHAVVWINSADGSPPRKVGQFIDDKLVMLTSYEWRAVNGGWTVASVSHAAYRNGKPFAEGRVSSSGVPDVGARAGSASAMRLASRAISWLAPTDANAQVLQGQCRWQWLQYIAAQAALSAATIALEVNPQNPALYAAWLAAAAAATLAEIKLYLCETNADSKQNPIPGGGPPPNTTPLSCQMDPTLPGCTPETQ